MSRYWVGTPNQHRQTNRLKRRMQIGDTQRELFGKRFSHMDTAAFLAQNGLAATALRCFPTEPTFGARATTVCGGLGRSARPRPRRGILKYLVRFLDDPGPIKLPLPPARYTTSTGAVRGSWCLQVHLASAFARGVQRNVDSLQVTIKTNLLAELKPCLMS